ncbi:MAG: hypothetical protein EXS15_08210 [Phycisphaerales bacterium]|nr:hypothetical protein [Phycisphaerales bacterium]
MTMCGDLASGRWPGATIGQRYVDCDLKFHSKLHRLTILDYPGEVFTKAFVRGESDSEDAASLLDHVDHAKGVILLIDPKNALESRDHTTRADDDFGMTAVVDRIRTYPGGEAVPIAIVLTKCDLHEAKILELGGLKVFISEYLHWITRTAGSHYKTFPCAAVRLTRESRTGNGAPSLVKSPINVIEPLIWILESLDSQIAKSQIAADSQAKSQSFNQTLAEVRDLIAQGVTNANCERAIRILADLTVEHHGDPRIQALRNEIEAARLDHEEHSEKRKTVFYLGFTVAMVVLLAGLVFALVHFLK